MEYAHKVTLLMAHAMLTEYVNEPMQGDFESGVEHTLIQILSHATGAHHDGDDQEFLTVTKQAIDLM